APYVRPWYAPVNARTPGLPVRITAVFSAASTASAPALARIVTPRSPGASAASRSSSATFASAGCTSPSACGSRSACRASARTTRAFACPAAATEKPAVRSTYTLPSASRTFAPDASTQKIGPASETCVMLRDSTAASRAASARDAGPGTGVAIRGNRSPNGVLTTGLRRRAAGSALARSVAVDRSECAGRGRGYGEKADGRGQPLPAPQGAGGAQAAPAAERRGRHARRVQAAAPCAARPARAGCRQTRAQAPHDP